MTKKTDANYGKGQVAIDETQDTLDPMLAQIRLGVKEAVSKENYEIPLLPHIAAQVLKMANDPKAGIPEIETLVKQDQVIAAKIVKTANSPFYRGVATIVSLRDAMSRIGLRSLKDIVFGLGLQSKVFKVKGYEETLNTIWNHSVACAAICQHLAKKLNLDAEHAFLSGLVHDIGKPVLIQVVSQFEEMEKKKIIDKAKKEFRMIDPKTVQVPGIVDILLPIVFNEYHATVGALVAARWKLPNSIIEVIQHHHDYTKAKEAKTMSTIVYTANLLCHHFGYGHEEAPKMLHHEKAFTELKMNPDQIKALENDVPPTVNSLMGVL